MGQGNELRNKDTNRNEKVAQANSRKEEKLVGTSKEEAIRKSSHATFILSTERKTCSRKAKQKMVR
jgi:hypothetical protein